MKEGVSLVIEIPDDIRILSVRQPWAWALFNGKDIENRKQKTKRRDWVLIHAGKQPAFRLNFANRWQFQQKYGLVIPAQLPFHGIIGMVRIVDCVTESDSKWFEGPFGYVMADAIPFPTQQGPGGVVFPFIERDGALSFIPALNAEKAAIRRYLASIGW